MEKMVKIESHCEEKDGLKYEPPALCPVCGADLRPRYVVAGSMGPHLRLDIAPGCCLYQCFSCNAMLGNFHLKSNIKIMKERESVSRLMQPDRRIITAH